MPTISPILWRLIVALAPSVTPSVSRTSRCKNVMPRVAACST